MNDVRVCKIFTFDSAHQLIGHDGKCANVHGHTYKLEVVVKGPVFGAENEAKEGFVIDFGDLKKIVKAHVVDKLDHAFIAAGNEPVLETLRATGSKIAELGFRTTAENMCMYIAHALRQTGLPIYSIRLWETGTSYAEVLASDIPLDGPTYGTRGDCNCD